ncbi:MAG: glycosyltransferase family 2 protein [Ignavibacteria bacterium]
MNNTERPVSISIVSPVYKSEKIVDELVKRLSDELTKITDNFEIVLPEDGSGDGTWEQVEKNCKQFDFVKGVKLSRNFGQHYAITAGLSQASGDIIVIMDCDLQDDPAHIKKLFDEFNKGYDVVFTKRMRKKHSFFKK